MHRNEDRVMRVVFVFAVLVLLAIAPMAADAQSAGKPVSVATATGDHVLLTVAVDDGQSRSQVAAMIVRLDGRDSQHIILTPGVGRTSYTALLGPLEAGSHIVALVPSPYWPADPAVRIREVTARVVRQSDPASVLLGHAPTIGVRADTIGTASDLPLVMYVEDLRQAGEGLVRYSVIFSNEDGGTSTPALLARWGRTTDIEFVYEIEWRGGRMTQEHIQAPDHRVLSFKGAREGNHPYLLVSTLNNMVMDRGLSVAAVRPAPLVVDLSSATRESVMDREPWTYRVMARELADEGRINPDVRDPREYLFVEAKLDLQNAAVAVVVQSPEGLSDSAAVNETWAVDRNGWVRIAVRAPASATSIQCRCAPRRKNPADAARCSIDVTRAFRLDSTYTPGANLAGARPIRMGEGLSEPIPLTPAGAGK
jgi:hypothetical protein